MKQITIEDFTGGRNTIDSPLLIGANECITTSQNVWAPRRALTKTPGTAVLYTLTSTANGIYSIYANSTLTSASQLYYRIATAAGATAGYFPWTGEGDSLTPLGYVTGTVATNSSNVSATGLGTSWSTHVTAGDLFRLDGSPSTWIAVSSVEDATHLTLASAPPSTTTAAYTIMPALHDEVVAWATLNGSWWSSTTADWLQRYNTTGMTRIQAGPKAEFLEPFKNYLFGLRTTTAQSRLYWSTFKDPTSWPSTNFIDIDSSNGVGAGLKAYGNELIVWKSNSMHKVVGEVFDPSNPTYAVYPIITPPTFQFNAGFTPVVHNGYLYFFGNGAMYLYAQGRSSIQEVSQKFTRDLPSTISSIGSTASPYALNMHCISVENNLLVKGITYNSTSSAQAGAIMDPRNAWWIHQGGEETSGGRWAVITTGSASKPRVVFSSRAKNYIYEYQINPYYTGVTATAINASGGSTAAIAGSWTSKEFNVEYGTFKDLIIYLSKQTAGSLLVDWSIDQGSFVSNTVDMTVGRGNLIRAVLPIFQKGSTIQVRVSNSTSDQNFEIFAIRINYVPMLEDRKL